MKYIITSIIFLFVVGIASVQAQSSNEREENGNIMEPISAEAEEAPHLKLEKQVQAEEETIESKANLNVDPNLQNSEGLNKSSQVKAIEQNPIVLPNGKQAESELNSNNNASQEIKQLNH